MNEFTFFQCAACVSRFTHSLPIFVDHLFPVLIVDQTTWPYTNNSSLWKFCAVGKAVLQLMLFMEFSYKRIL